jgi:hypothetical protein
MEFGEGLVGLNKTWFIDLDGTLIVHNAHKNGGDILLPNTLNFINSIDKNDIIVLTTAREEIYSDSTINFLNENGVRFNHIIFGLPSGPRILINDNKPDGTKTAFAINIERNVGINLNN